MLKKLDDHGATVEDQSYNQALTPMQAEKLILVFFLFYVPDLF